MKLYIKEFYKEQNFEIRVGMIHLNQNKFGHWAIYIRINDKNYYFGDKGCWYANSQKAITHPHYSQTKYFADQLKTIDTRSYPHIIKI